MLTEFAVKAAKASEKPRKLFDAGGLCLLVNPSGGRLWRLKYFDGKERLLTLGSYPDTSLKRAREKRDEYRRQLEDGIDPGAKKRMDALAAADTFEAIAAEWLDLQRKTFAPVNLKNHAATVEPKRMAELLRAIDVYSGDRVTEFALKLAPLLFVRPGELRAPDWKEFDLTSNPGSTGRRPQDQIRPRSKR